MTNGESTDLLIEEIDELLSDESMNQKTVIRLNLAVSRAVLKQVTADRTLSDKTRDRVDTMWPAYHIMVWVMGVLGLSVIALLFSLATGTAAIVVR